MKRVAALVLAVFMAVSMTACGSTGGSSAGKDVEYNIIGNYVFKNADGGNTDAEGATWYLYVDAESKFHLVGVKNYEGAAASVRIDEGQVVSVSGYTLDCGFTPYSQFTQYLHHGTADEQITAAVIETSGEAIGTYQDESGNEFFQIQLERTSNDMTNSGTFSVTGDITLGWGAWQD